MSKEQYYLADSAYAYPSSNANDGGEDNTEDNLRLVTDKIAIRNFVVMRKTLNKDYLNYFVPSYSSSPKGIKVTGGECSINGYYLNLKETVLEIPDQLDPDSAYVVALKIYKDGVGNLRGDGISVVEPNEGSLESRGVTIGYYAYREMVGTDLSQFLVLFTFMTDDQGNIPTDDKQYFQDMDRFVFINSEMIATSTGDRIENWVNNRISYELSRLDKLQHWDDTDTELESSLTLESSDVIINLKDRGSSISIANIEDRTQVAPKGEMTDVPVPSTIGYSNDTYNGDSTLLARADHHHDDRYIVKNVSDSISREVQEINTKLEVKDHLIVSSRLGESYFYCDPGIPYASFKDGLFIGPGGSVLVNNWLYVGSLSSPPSDISKGDIYANGKIVASGTITGSKVYNAVWNDYADAVPKSEGTKVDPGDIICKSPSSNKYELSTYKNRKLVVGVCSDTYGHLLGGDKGKTLEETLKTHIPIAVAGNVRVKVVGKVKAGDLIVASKINGVGKVGKWFTKGRVVGKALESKSSKDLGKVLIQVSVC